MKTITYTFADGTVDTVEVTDELNAVHEELQKADKLSERRETRRHVSLEKIRTHGWDVADPKVDVFADVAKKEKYSYLYAAIATLTPAQQLLLKKIFWEGKKQKEVAEEQGVKKAAIHNR